MNLRQSVNGIGRICLLAVFVVTAAMSSPVAAQADAEPAFIVELDSDGSAVVSVRSTFDLTTDAEQAAFRSLETDEDAQQAAANRFLDRMRSVASDAENATVREMRVSGATIDLQRTADNGTGIVTLAVTWEGLAAVQGESVVVTEPFASGFSPDRRFVVQPPEGYTVSDVAPEPTTRSADQLTWRAGTDLTGFSAEFQPAATPTEQSDGDGETTRTDGQPGFGLMAAIIAVFVAIGAMAASRRRT